MHVLVVHGSALVLDAEVPLAFVWWSSVGVAFAAFPPTVEGGKERLHAGVGGVGMQFVRGVEAHEVLRLEPHSLAPHRAPKEDQRL